MMFGRLKRLFGKVFPVYALQNLSETAPSASTLGRMYRLPQMAMNWLERLCRKLFPVYTHCTACGRKLPYKDRAGLCQDCLMW